jgi:alpha-mannosidase
MHKEEKFIEARAHRILTQKLPDALYRDSVNLELSSWVVPDEPVPFEHAISQTFTPFENGSRWGKPWGTTWLKVEGVVPKEWKLDNSVQLELEVDLGFTVTQPGFQAEALVWTPQGKIIKAVEPRNRAVKLNLKPGEKIDLYLEAASNPDVARDWSYRKTEMGHKSTAGTDFQYQLQHVRVGLLDLEVWNLIHDLDVLLNVAKQLSVDSPRRSEILRAIESSLDAIDLDAISQTAKSARDILKPILQSPASPSAHTVHAVGHAHIDTAWLWPLRETRRKVARTFSNALDLIDQSEGFVFAASSAQQYLWIKEDYPELFERIREGVKGGRFVPIGGMWIEPDANVPSGESLTRQLLEGKKFFMDEFGVEPKDVWLPDSFGYSGSLPQIVAEGGSNWFLSQKLSWSDTNLFPHHSFLWEGIDGTQIFTHFPPADTYNAMISPAELHKAESSFLEKGRANTSLLPFGWGNGGGGPTRDMVAGGHRQKNLEGSPKVEFSSPERFFRTAEEEYKNPPVWVGELYLEFHRATSTTQAPIKRGNRLAERLMREVEYWWSTASIQKGVKYPSEEIRKIWHDVLLLQFHDILPGTSIQWVHEEVIGIHESIQSRATSLIEEAVHVLLGRGTKSARLNASPFELEGIEAFGAGESGFGQPAKVEEGKSGVSLENSSLKISFNSNGNITSIYDKWAAREVIPEGTLANLLQLHPDFPSVWDAWDVDRSYKNTVTDITSFEKIEILERDGKSVHRVTRKFGKSIAIQEVSLGINDSSIAIDLDVDWHENEKFLKLAFPIDLQTWNATNEIQYGHLVRPIHVNTSWDSARFEALAHRWVHIGEPNYGVALANNATYGHDITRSRIHGKNFTTIRASVLRAPNFPDPTSDRGRHNFSYILQVGSNISDAIRTGYAMNVPLREISGVASDEVTPLFRVETGSVIVEATKLAEDGSGDLIVRCYESQGVRSHLVLTPSFEVKDVVVTDSLERQKHGHVELVEGNIGLEFTPFQLRTIRITRK